MVYKYDKSTIGLFLIVLIVLSAPLQFMLVKMGASPRLTYGLIMWSVGLAAIVTLMLKKQSLVSLGWHWGPWKYHAIAVALPIGYAIVAYLGAWRFGLIHFAGDEQIIQLKQTAGFENANGILWMGFVLIFIFFGSLISGYGRALGEEIGWRGFLTPALTHQTGFLGATFITGVIWAAWHWPILIYSGYNAGGPPIWELAAFTFMVLSISGPFAWLRLKSGSLWPAATYHAVHNIFIQNIMDPLSVRGDTHLTIVTEFGIALAASAFIFSLPFWYYGHKEFGKPAR